MRHRIATIIIGLCLCCTSSAVTASEEVFEGKTMGPVPYRVVLNVLPADESRDAIAAAIAEELENVNQRMSTYQPDSEVSQFNRTDSTDWFPVSSETAYVVKRSLEISRASDGAFDITVAPLVNLWSFGPDGRPEAVPTDEQIQAALAQIGYTSLESRREPPALRKSKPDLTIDLSAIAKGYAVDEVARRLIKLGATDFLVEVGGEVRAKGKSPRGTPWMIGIEQPIPTLRVAEVAVPLSSGKSMATSGDYRNFFFVDGQAYSHTIDPSVGRPVSHAMHSVSVIANDCLTADAWATALMVLGPDQIPTYASRADIEASWIRSAPKEDGERTFLHSKTHGFPAMQKGNSAEGEKKSAVWPMFAAALIVFVVALMGMAIGVIFSNRTIKGSCGGLAALRRGDEKSPCEVCQSRSTCDEYQKATQDS